ncbi:DUF397 domain-containing protein [Endozoicomonas arenosclerae]|uniref:DUF397 domain-containing protein n=1 Tax=Endozoicomonas arenosclerae TaxID=1633495 RepID=UPI00078247B7|nr:DUF397 domain-containing protein [Endozoicomonas arenosclerae]
MKVVFKDTDFKTSSFTHGVISCVEVAIKDGHIAVRNNRRPEKGMVLFDELEWSAFLKGVKNNEFEL